MEDASGPRELKFLVVHESVVVAEDMRDMLVDLGATRVDIRRSLSDEWGTGYFAAFFAAYAEDLLTASRVVSMAVTGTHIVLLDFPPPGAMIGGAPLFALPQPFSHVDLLAVLRQIGLPVDG